MGAFHSASMESLSKKLLRITCSMFGGGGHAEPFYLLMQDSEIAQLFNTQYIEGSDEVLRSLFPSIIARIYTCWRALIRTA